MIVISSPVDERTRAMGREILERIQKHERNLFNPDVDMKLMRWAMKDERLKVQLFRFVDVLPTLNSAEDVMTHLREYFNTPGQSFPVLGQWGINLASSSGLAARAAAAAVQKSIGAMARNFIAGSNAAEAAKVVRELRKRRMTFTVDILGEVAVSEREALRYQQTYLDLIRDMSEEAKRWQNDPILDEADGAPIPKVNVSVKLSSIYSQWEPADPTGSAEAIKDLLRPILSLGKQLGALVNVDMEHYAVKDSTLRIFREIAMEPEFRDWQDIGIVLQAYLRDSEADARDMVEWAKERGTPINVRLVRGAYWDAETAMAGQRHWPVPVFTQKHETDQSFENITELLLGNYPVIKTAIASHNVRSIARAIALAESMNLPERAVEFQMLYGMGDPIKHALVDLGQRVRIYTPYGDLMPGMAYLVRRLLENTSNESFLRQGFEEKASVDALLRTPEETAKLVGEPPVSTKYAKAFPNVAERDFSKEEHRVSMLTALAKVRKDFGRSYPLVIGGKDVTTGSEIESLNPSRPSEVVGRVSSATAKEAAMAVEAAKTALPAWRDMGGEKRAEILLRAAEIMKQQRDELAALQVFEAGKNWREADADVCETIDYLIYYAQEGARFAKQTRLGPVPAETNDYFYEPKGIALVISPWNFPMAICAGMTTAAIAAGNTAVVKPASQTPIIAAKLVEILMQAGLPGGVVNFLPGPGREIGDYLVTHPDINVIAFTGSQEIGCRINRLAADVSPGQKHLKKVIAEMGGKNATIVDSDADLDEAVMGTLWAAFGYQGQKCSACSRVVVLESVYDKFVGRLVEAARSIHIGHADDPRNFMGPVIDKGAMNGILEYIKVGKTEAKLVLERDVTELGDGYFIGPTIFIDVPPSARIAQEEIFGPVLSVIKAKDLDHAIEIALGVDFALTGGIFSRNPGNIQRARREFRVGNLYINRKITGAIVGRQPFGGFKMSGIGSKAGGPDYLLQFMDPRTVTENTLRRGFAPEEDV